MYDFPYYIFTFANISSGMNILKRKVFNLCMNFSMGPGVSIIAMTSQ